MSSRSIAWYLAESSSILGLGLSGDMLEKLDTYAKLLLKWNKAYNLTALRKEEDIAIKHFIDSLVVLNYIEKPISCLDVGTGAGFPGMVLAICRPDLKWTLLDANQKKIRFLTQVAHELNINNVNPVASRVETYSEANHDWIICRAYSSIVKVLDQVEHLKAPSAKLVAMKGLQPIDELKEIEDRAVEVQLADLNVPFLNEKRCLVTIQ